MGISREIRQALDTANLTYYGASQVIGSDNPGTPQKTISNKLGSWCGDSPPEYLNQLDSYMDSLGFEIRVVRKGAKKI